MKNAALLFILAICLAILAGWLVQTNRSAHKEPPVKMPKGDGAAGAERPGDPEVAFTVVINEVGQYLTQADAPKRAGLVTFTSYHKIAERGGNKSAGATFHYSYNGFTLRYDLTGVLKPGTPEKKEFNASDFAKITIRYTDDLLEAKGLTGKDVKGLIEQLRDPGNRVQSHGSIIPGGEMLSFSLPMKKLMLLGGKARGPLEASLPDKQIQNEVALILGAIGDETTVPALINVYPEGDLREAEPGGPSCMRGICLTFALTYLTAQPIGRSRWGCDLKPENKQLWKDWWARAGTTFKVPATKPNATWVPMYPVLTEEWAAQSRLEFAKGRAFGA